MSAKQAAFLTSRIISLWFFYRALSTLVQIPAAFAMISAFSSLRNMPGFNTSSARLFAESGALAFQGCVEILLAVFFYRCGPLVLRFLLGDEEQTAVVDENGV